MKFGSARRFRTVVRPDVVGEIRFPMYGFFGNSRHELFHDAHDWLGGYRTKRRALPNFMTVFARWDLPKSDPFACYNSRLFGSDS